MLQTTQKGFALKKLMIATAVFCGLIVAFSILYGMFQSDMSRSQVSEAVSLLNGAKQPFSEYFSGKRKWPDAAQQVLGNTSGKYTDSIAITSGAGAPSGTLILTATMKAAQVDSRIAGKTVQISTEDGKTWTCRAGRINGVGDMFLPMACRP